MAKDTESSPQPSLEKMLPTLVHALRTPLSGLTMGIEVAALRLRAHDDETGFLQPMRDTLFEMNRTLDELTRFVRQAKANVVRLDVQQFFMDTARAWGRLHPEACVQWQQNAAGSAPQAKTEPLFALDIDSVHQSIENLLDNALEAGGKASIRLALRHTAHNQVCFTVSDAGPPVPNDVLERMTEPFFTTKHRHLGLGLAFVARVASAHNGSLVINAAAQGMQVALHLGGA